MTAGGTQPPLLHATHPQLIGSLYRSGGTELIEVECQADKEGLLALWWGPRVPVGPGCTVSYFVTSSGLAFESVNPPREAYADA